MSVLGEGLNQAFLYGRGGTTRLADLTGAVGITWDRRMDDASQADVVIGVPGHAGDCCEVLGFIGTWGHELVIYRDAVRVWEGPITNIVWARDQVRITARDVLGFLQRRYCSSLLIPDTDPAQSALGLARNDMNAAWVATDNAAPYLVQVGNDADATGVHAERNVASGYVLDALQDFVKSGVHFTTVGRRTILWHDEVSIGHTGTLYPDMHVSGEVELVEDGMALATRVAATSDTEAGLIMGQYGAEDTFYGLVDGVRNLPVITTVDALTLSAQTLRNKMYPAPQVLNIAQDSVLSCDAPFDMGELVAGTLMQVQMDSLCRRVSVTQQLTSVKVTQSGEGEQVAITVEPISASLAAASGGLIVDTAAEVPG